MKIGIIGTGAMGLPMSINLLKSTGELFVYARHREKVTALAEQGATVVATPAELGAACKLILLSLPFDPDVEDVLLGEDGVLSRAAAGTIILDTTTGTPAAAVDMASRCLKKGIGYIDAPISGGVKRAETAELTFIVGGEKRFIDPAMPVMELLGSEIFVVGPVGSGRVLKSLNQIIAGMNTLVLCETVAMGLKFGISPQTFYDVLSKCAANSFHLQTKLPNFIIPDNFDGGHRIEMMIKDLEIGLGIAKEKKFPLMLTGLGNQLYRAGAGSGYADRDISAMVKFFSALCNPMPETRQS